MRQCLAHPCSHGGFRHVEERVDAGDDVVEPGQELIVVVERAVLEDVDLGALDDLHALAFLVELVDLGPLFSHRVGRQAAGDGERLRVVADAEVFEAEFLRGQRHLFQGGDAVAVGRVVVEDAADVRLLDEHREFLFLGDGDLIGVLAQLGRDVVEAESLVDVRLGLRGDRLLLVRQRVLVERDLVDRCRSRILCSLLPVKYMRPR